MIETAPRVGSKQQGSMKLDLYIPARLNQVVIKGRVKEKQRDLLNSLKVGSLQLSGLSCKKAGGRVRRKRKGS